MAHFASAAAPNVCSNVPCHRALGFLDSASFVLDRFTRTLSISNPQNTANATCSRAFSLSIVGEVRHMSLNTESAEDERVFEVSQGLALCVGTGAECTLGYYGAQDEDTSCENMQEANLGTSA